MVFKSKKEKEELAMKRLIIFAMILMFTAGTVAVFAVGGKNQGITGSVQLPQETTPRVTYPNREPADNYSRLRVAEIPWI